MSETLKNYRREDLLSAVTGNGKGRALLVCAPIELGTKELTQVSIEAMRRESGLFSSLVDARKIINPKDFCSQFARNLRTGSGATPQDLARFALSVGKSLISVKPKDQSNIAEKIDETKEAIALAAHYAELAKSNSKLLLCIAGLDKVSEEVLFWLSGELNHAIRKVPAFRNTRFIFTTESENKKLEDFFNRFGFEKVRRCQVAKQSKGRDEFKAVSTGEDGNQADAQLKRLIIAESSPKLKDEKQVMEIPDVSEKFLSSFKEVEKLYLALASYPTRVSRYSLEHFTDSRKAALCYNWLKRQPNLRTLHPSGDLVLTDEARKHARAYHQSIEPEKSKQWGEIASVLDLFYQCLPYEQDHAIAINLQAFGFINQKLLDRLFNRDEQAGINLFVERNPDQLLSEENSFVLSDDAKLVTRRYMELCGKAPIPGLLERVQELWNEDQMHYQSKRAKLDQEKKNLTDELEDTLQQIVKMKELKDKLLEDFKNPQRFKPEKVYSFTTQKALIVLGLITCGASVYFDTLGSYHAACGLALTLFGFFWPNIEVKKATAGNEGPRSNLAIETQQRSLKHRINGLGNRAGVMKNNINDIDGQIATIGDTPPPSYIEEFPEE